MFDFRYHALSLVAVLLALAIGLLLGVAIGDRGLVSGAEGDLRASLRKDVRSAQADATELRHKLSMGSDYQDAAYPLLVGGELRGRNVGIVALGTIPDQEVRNVADALGPSGAKLASVSIIRQPLDLPGIASALPGSAYTALPTANTDLVAQLGRRVGISLAAGSPFVGQLRRPLLVSASGNSTALDSIVLVRSEPALTSAQATAADAFAGGLLAGFQRRQARVVGVETAETTPSQIHWYGGLGLPSVDNVDQQAGQAALIFTLAGANGAFGAKRSAQGLLPKAKPPPAPAAPVAVATPRK